ncbi:MAG: hypothetical protein LBO00_10470 [Zoogloeaceae bacterium]|jgi:type IV pilus assembly protein PilE|nr:hypothetical protein [Zoogloeaceae bacterium]
MKARKETGFTLVELTLVAATVVVLAAFAYPSYKQHLLRTRRADCESTLMSAAALMERKHSVANKYTSTGLTLPAKCPQEGTKKFYTVTLTSTDSTFTFTATPEGTQTADKCGTLSLKHTGVKGTTGGSVSGCW